MPDGATTIVQGFGNVGSVSAYTLARRDGARVAGISDHTAALFDPPACRWTRTMKENG